MKILCGPQGDGLLTNAEVLQWLREKRFDAGRKDLPPGEAKTPHATARLATFVRSYIEASPAAAETVQSVSTMCDRLRPYSLSSTELLMLANIRPTAYAQITPLIADVHNRYSDDQINEILTIISELLPPKESAQQEEQQQKHDERPEEQQVLQSLQSMPISEPSTSQPSPQNPASSAEASAPEQLSTSPIDATTTDLSQLPTSPSQGRNRNAKRKRTITATVTDLTDL